MSESFIAVNVELNRWMQPAPNKDGLDALMFGKVVDSDTLLVVVLKNGGSRFYCSTHQRVFQIAAQCPDCAGNAIPEPATA